jgi:hypothetical protein
MVTYMKEVAKVCAALTYLALMLASARLITDDA